ncbi:MAG: D-aminoacylase [Sulfolobales archaeon]|nr:D-aminoacylase [Sulfolobales archaeon]
MIRNGKVVTGLSSSWIGADVGIRDGKVVEVGYLGRKQAEIIIDAKGKFVVPGFIDIHNHSDITLISQPSALNSLMQGVTTVVVGNCGFSAAPVLPKALSNVRKFWSQLSFGVSVDFTWNSFKDYLEILSKVKPAVNVVPLVGHGTVRINALGFSDEVPGPEELDVMKSLVDEAMRSGAFGISTGLIYPPNSYASTEEVVELAKVVSGYGGIYSTHIRSESNRLMDAVLESLEIGRRAGVPVEISHLKAAGRPNWGKVKQVIDLIRSYRDGGVEVNYDLYPYTAGSTSLISLIPQKFFRDGFESLIRNLGEKGFRDEVIKYVNNSSDWENLLSVLDWGDVVISYSEGCKSCEGKSVLSISKELGVSPYDVFFDLILRDEGRTLMIMHFINEDDLIYALKQPYSNIGSDSFVIPKVGKPHPRFYGTFPRVIKRYVKELGILTLEEAISKMTSNPAQKLRLRDRGMILPGCRADIVVLDVEKLDDRATFEEPNNHPVGIEYVVVNGVVSVWGGNYTGNRNGVVVTKGTTVE